MSTPREPGVWRTTLLTIVIVPTVLPSRNRRMPGPAVEPEPATAELPTWLPSIRPLIVPPVEVDDEKALIVGPPLPVIDRLFSMWNVRFPLPNWSKSAAAAPLFVNVLPLTLKSPIDAVSPACTWRPDEKLLENVAPEIE